MCCLLFNGCVYVCVTLLMELDSCLFGTGRKIHVALGLIYTFSYSFTLSQIPDVSHIQTFNVQYNGNETGITQESSLCVLTYSRQFPLSGLIYKRHHIRL